MYLLELPRRGFLQISKMYVFLKNNMGLSTKNTRTADFCADQIDIITNFAVITNAVVKRVHCNLTQFHRHWKSNTYVSLLQDIKMI